MTIADRKAARPLPDGRQTRRRQGGIRVAGRRREGPSQSRLAGEFRGGSWPACTSAGQEVILVSSGAIALGRRHLGLNAGKLKLEESQAAAAVGQIRLAHAYKELLDGHHITVAQILLTLGDTEQRRRYLNARGTLNMLLSLEAIPVINENDTVATAEIRYGDNDRLAARVAQMVGADCLVLLSDIDGLYTPNPPRTPTPNSSPACSKSLPQSKPWRAGSSSDMGSGRHADENRRGQDCGGGGLPFVHRQRRRSSTPCSASRRVRAAPGSSPPRRRSRPASSGSPVP